MHKDFRLRGAELWLARCMSSSVDDKDFREFKQEDGGKSKNLNANEMERITDLCVLVFSGKEDADLQEIGEYIRSGQEGIGHNPDGREWVKGKNQDEIKKNSRRRDVNEHKK